MCGCEASSLSERFAKADLNQNKRCLDRRFYKDDKPQPLCKKAVFLQGNITKHVSKTSDEDKKENRFNCFKKFMCLQCTI